MPVVSLQITNLSLVFIVVGYQFAGAIDCFKCVSKNGDNPACDDPFHNNYSAAMFHAPCWAGRKDRNGVFPASACIKINGVDEEGNYTVIRDCALDSGSLTTDTELVRMSHCGGFYLSETYISGCVQNCHEDACNTSHDTHPEVIITSLCYSIIFVWMFIQR